MQKNQLYFGDNLDVLRRYMKDESVDLVYLDPPFNSRQDYNVLFKEKDGTSSSSQITAFEDTWEWNTESKRVYEELVERGDRVSDVMRAFHTFIHGSDMMAYLAMMAPRLIELHRVLKPTGSIYLHCDPTASHYLKLLMDAIFGPSQFLNEIIWKRTFAHGSSKRFGPIHDVLLFYAKSDAYFWANLRSPHDPAYVAKHFTLVDDSGRHFSPITLTGSGIRSGESGKPWRGIDPTRVKRHWAVPGKRAEILGLRGTVQEKLGQLDAAGLIYWPEKKGGTPRLKWYADELEGTALQDIWTDIAPISANAAERLGYPTQKPEALLERIIKASSNEGDVVLDPFCGCGTAVAAAQKLKRCWIGIDVTYLATGLIKQRLRDGFSLVEDKDYEVIGEPEDLESARALAGQDRFQFQAWALGLVGARKSTSALKGADSGIDGKLFFRDERDEHGELKQIILSVKSGGVQVRDVRDLVGTLQREKAEIGVLITLEEPSKPMVKEAVEAGFFKSKYYGYAEKVPRVQILTIEELFAGKRIEFPRAQEETFKQAPKARGKKAENLELPLK